MLARHGTDVLGACQVWPVADLVHFLRVMPVRKAVLGGKALLREGHVLVELFVVVAHRPAGSQTLDEIDGLGWRILFACAGRLFTRRVNLVFAVVLQRVRNVRFTYMMGERRLVADVAG